MARPDDELPEVEVVGGAREARTEVEIESAPSRRSRSRWIIGALVFTVILSAIGLSARGDGTEQDEGADPTTTSTTKARSTTSTSRPSTTRPSLTDGAYLAGSPEPLLGEPVNASLLLLPHDGGAPRQVNLDTGWVVEFPGLRRSDGWWQSVPLENSVVLHGPSGPWHFSLPAVGPGQIQEPEDVELQIEGLDHFAQHTEFVSSGRPDRFWVLTEATRPDSSAQISASLIDPSGTRLASIDPMPTWSYIGSALGMLFNAGGDAYLAREGGVTPLGPGKVYAASGNYAAKVTCDPSLSCKLAIVDLLTGEVVAESAIPAAMAAEESFNMVQAPDGSIATNTTSYYLPRPGGAQPAHLYVLRPDGRSLSVETQDAWSPLIWLPGELGLLALNDQGVAHYIEQDGHLVERWLRGLDPDHTASIVVIPHGPGPEGL